MVTQCTACLVWFRVTREQLHAAHGLVRCSACNTVFNALASLRHEMPEGGIAAGSAPVAREKTADDIGASVSAGREVPEADATDRPEQADERAWDATGDAAAPEDKTPAADDRPPATPEAYLGMPGNALELESGPDTPEAPVAPAPAHDEISELEFYLAAALDDEYIRPLPEYTRIEARVVKSAATPALREDAPATQREETGAEPEPDADAGFADRGPDEESPEGDAVPVFAMERGNRWQRRAWGLILVVAALALAAQIVYAQRGALGRIFDLPPSEPVLHQYAISGATLDAAQQPGALVLKGTLVNQGRRAQRLPLIRVTLTDRYGDAVGARILSPRQYGADRKSLLHAHQHFMFHVKLADPGSSAVGFSLVLCKHHGHSILCQDS